MVERGTGRVLNVASVGAFGPVPGQAVTARPRRSCCPTPRRCGEELRGTGVTAATLCPGPVDTASVRRRAFRCEEAEVCCRSATVDGRRAGRKVAVDGLDVGQGGDRSRRIQPAGAAMLYQHAAAPAAATAPGPQPSRPEEELAEPDEVQDVARDGVGLFELQEVPGARRRSRTRLSAGSIAATHSRVVRRGMQPSSAPCRYSVGSRSATVQCRCSSAYRCGRLADPPERGAVVAQRGAPIRRCPDRGVDQCARLRRRRSPATIAATAAAPPRTRNALAATAIGST